MKILLLTITTFSILLVNHQINNKDDDKIKKGVSKIFKGHTMTKTKNDYKEYFGYNKFSFNDGF